MNTQTPTLPGMPEPTRTPKRARTRRCMDCGSRDDVRVYPVESWPAKWGPYSLCRTCREILEDIDMRFLALMEPSKLAEWGTRGKPAPPP